MNLPSYKVSELLPHDEPMILIDRLLGHDTSSVQTEVTIRDNSPFLRDGMVPAYVAIEYMAQTIAVFSGLKAKASEGTVRIGLLLGSRKLQLMTDSFAVGDCIKVTAKESYNDGSLAAFDCIATRDNCKIAEARINVYQPADGN